MSLRAGVTTGSAATAAAEAAGFEDLTGEPRLPPHLQALVGKKGA